MDPEKMVHDIEFYMSVGHYQRAESILRDLSRWVADQLKECTTETDMRS